MKRVLVELLADDVAVLRVMINQPCEPRNEFDPEALSFDLVCERITNALSEALNGPGVSNLTGSLSVTDSPSQESGRGCSRYPFFSSVADLREWEQKQSGALFRGGWDYAGMPNPGPKVCTDAEGGKDSDRRDEGAAMDGPTFDGLVNPRAAEIVEKNRAKWSDGGGLNSLVAEIDKAVIEGFADAAQRESAKFKAIMAGGREKEIRESLVKTLKGAIPGLLDVAFQGVQKIEPVAMLIPVTFEELDPEVVPDEADELEAVFVAECPGAIITPAVEIEEKPIAGEEFHMPRVPESVEEILGPSPAMTAAGELVELPEGAAGIVVGMDLRGPAGSEGDRTDRTDRTGESEDEGDVPGMALVEMSAESEGEGCPTLPVPDGHRPLLEREVTGEEREAEPEHPGSAFVPRPEEPVIKVEEPVVPSGAPSVYKLPLASIFDAMKVIHLRKSKAETAEKLKRPEWFVNALKAFFAGIGANVHPRESEPFDVWRAKAKKCLDESHARAFQIDVREAGCTVLCAEAPVPPSSGGKKKSTEDEDGL